MLISYHIALCHEMYFSIMQRVCQAQWHNIICIKHVDSSTLGTVARKLFDYSKNSMFQLTNPSFLLSFDALCQTSKLWCRFEYCSCFPVKKECFFVPGISDKDSNDHLLNSKCLGFKCEIYALKAFVFPLTLKISKF